MTAEYAPDAVASLYDRLNADRPGWHLANGGVTGNPDHTYGYHRSRFWDARYSSWSPPPDYSIRHADDQDGDGNAASAIDITPQGSNAAEVLATMTGRLIQAVDGGDPRARFIAEFYGTVNGTSVTGRFYGSPSSADDSHLWHLHIAGRRRYANDQSAWDAIADIILGNPAQVPENDERWSDTVTRDEVLELIRAEVTDGLRAVVTGGDHGYFTVDRFGTIVHAEDQGLQDRVNALEKAQAK